MYPRRVYALLWAKRRTGECSVNLKLHRINVITVPILLLAGIATTITPLPAHRQPTSACLEVKHIKISDREQATALKEWTLRAMLSALAFDLSVLGSANDRARHIAQYLTALKTIKSTNSCAVAVPASNFPSSAPTAIPFQIDNPDSMAFDGYGSVGKIFFRIDGLRKEFCTAETVNSEHPPRGGSMLILTAAHCLDGTWARFPYVDTQFAFAPNWINGKTPYQLWSVSNIWDFSQWLECPVPFMDCHEDPIDDYTIMEVSPIEGKHIPYYTGANGSIINEPASLADIQIVGYVQGQSRPRRAFTNTVTVTENSQFFRSGKAGGLGPGTSGGGWFLPFTITDGSES
jgi:hypothetical protein